ncbi:chaperone protein dnaK [Cordyceps fumosorosea ARSEF 2679]|uniref:Chaperone protein dnaK n=1 Tax=Cordyceps fumosorosea (strain ARSEF 2679) TaxID=1081104 RepID=A0A167W172_CORFA|nr:chaperone protein dnaK [Cordyceps fumosorosea ARSEF 2679]OAA63208.1 chaperone protein dnaK [Cordyceps fumosorosea ARSEF 2679]
MARLRLSSLMALLGAVFFLSANVMAVSAVLGVDLGTEYIKAALVKPGVPLDIVLTKDSRRKEASAVAFKPAPGGAKPDQFPERAYGADALALSARFPGEVYPNLKTILGLPVGDAIVADYAARHPALQLQAHASRGTPSFKTNTLTAEEESWMVEELLAMQLQSIQKNAEALAGEGSSVRSVVMSIPPFYTTEERRALQLAAEMANLRVLSIMSDGLAVGLNYATSRQFPNINEGAKPEHHLVFDMGAGSTTATVLKFQSRNVKDVGKYNKTVQEVQSLGAGWDRTLGGDALNYLITDDMVSQFVESKSAQKISATSGGVRAHGRAMAKLIKEAERVRHVLSANQNTGASFEGLYEDVDFKYKLGRADFEAMAQDFPDRVAAVVNNALKMAGLDIVDIDTIILHGGATRTPFVQKALEKAIGSADKIRSNVNSDEAAVFGAGFRGAQLSPSFRVKEIRISEGSMYNAGIKYTNAKGKEQRQRLWTAASPLGGVPKELSFTDLKDFSGSFFQQVGDEDQTIATFSVKNLTATAAALEDKYPSCVDSETVFKLALKLASENGEVAVASAVVECEAEVKETLIDGVKNLFGFGKKESFEDGTDGKADATKSSKKPTKSSKSKKSSKTSKASKSSETSESSSSSTESASSSIDAKDSKSTEAVEAPKEDVKKKELVNIPVQVIIEKAGIPQFTKEELTTSRDRLKAFAASDKARIQREDALNKLEAFTYQVSSLLENDDFVAKSTEKERTALSEKARAASDWLYEDGTTATKDELTAKLKSLQDLAEPIQKRVQESTARPKAVKQLKTILDQTDKFLEGIYKQIDDHEEYLASSSAASSSTPTSSAPAESSTGDFDGLEDEDATEAPKEEVEEEKPAAAIPPLYKREDLTEIEKLNTETRQWLKEMETKQDKLGATEDPVLLSSDVAAKEDKLTKASMEVAMRGIRTFNPKKPKAKKPTKSKGKGKGKGKGKKFEAGDLDAEVFGEGIDQEELDRILDQIRKRQAEEGKKEGEGKKTEGESKKKDDNTEQIHDEL